MIVHNDNGIVFSTYEGIFLCAHMWHEVEVLKLVLKWQYSGKIAQAPPALHLGDASGAG